MKLKIEKRTGLKFLNISNIRSWNPCYDPSRHLKEDFKGTAIDILNHETIPFGDKLWVIFREEICSPKLMRLAAVYFYRYTLNWITNPDPRSIEAVNVAERYANGLATKEELAKAESAAWSAVESARLAESAAARLAVWSATWSARTAAESASWSASWSAAMSAAMSAGSAAESAAQKRYTNKLIEMIVTEGKERRK